MTSPGTSPSPSPSVGSSSAPSTTAPSTTAPSTAIVAAWQQALAAEHGAIFGYGSLGPRLDAGDALVARSDQTAHRAVRDAVETALTGLGVTPEPARADYPAPRPLTTSAQAQQFAADLETACASAWRFLVATAATEPGAWPAIRASAQSNLSSSAIRAVRWRRRVEPSSATVAFPGI